MPVIAALRRTEAEGSPRVRAQPGLHGQTLSQKSKQNKTQKKDKARFTKTR